ncbi:hypothetical protein EDB83DRAFT_2557224 [Lactarius deliciosus]|nr:hypothetical protein EDB83DRAFT_2557224 [Lactarius deliciosus]
MKLLGEDGRLPGPPISPSPGPSPRARPEWKEPQRTFVHGPARPSAAAAQGFSLGSPRPGGPDSLFAADAIDQWFENFHHYEVTLEEMAAASLDVNFKEELSAIEQWFKVLSEAERTAALYNLLQHSTQVQIHFFTTVLQQMARADPMTALLSPVVWGSMQPDGSRACNPPYPVPHPPAPSTPLPLSSLQMPPIPLASQATPPPHSPNSALNSKPPETPYIEFLRRRASGERGTWAEVLGQVAERGNTPTQEISMEPRSSRPQSTDFSGLSAGSAFRSPRADGGTAPGGLDGLSPAVGHSWASMVNMPLLPMFQKTSSNDSNNSQTVDLAATKLNDLYDGSNVPRRLDGPDKFRRPSKGHIHDGSSGVHHAPGVGRVQSGSSRGLRIGGGGTWSGGQSLALSNSSGRFGGSNDGSNVMAAAHQQQQAALAGLRMGVGGFNLEFGSPGLTRMPNGLNMAQLAQLNGMNPFNMNMNILNLTAMGCHPRRSYSRRRSPLLEEDSDVRPALVVAAVPVAEEDRPGTAEQGRDEEDFEPSVLNDVAGWLRTLRLHKYTPNFEGMTWKEMVVMDEQALEAQGVAALGARRKMLKTFEVVRKKMGIDDPTAPPPPSSGGSAPGAPGSSGGSAGSGGGLSA